MKAPGAPVDRVTLARALCCPYCGIRMTGKGMRPNAPTRDHVNPRMLGGGPVIMCCRRCNQDKGAQCLVEWCEAMLLAKDYRWRIVAALNIDLKAGRLKFVTGVVSTSGLAPGIFA